MQESQVNYRGYETTQSELIAMRRLITKKCQQIFVDATTMVDPAKIFSDMLEISQNHKDSQVEIPKQKEYLSDMTQLPKTNIQSTKQLTVSNSNISILGLKRTSDRFDMLNHDSNTLGWMASNNNGYFSIKVPTHKKMNRVAS